MTVNQKVTLEKFPVFYYTYYNDGNDKNHIYAFIDLGNIY